MIAQSRYLDLLGVLAGATNGAHRRAASAVLARELVTRMRDAGRQPQPVASTHPVFRDVPAADLAVDALLTGTKPADEALAAARYFLHLDRELCGIGTPYVQSVAAASPGAMEPARQNAERIAAQLRELVVADIGTGAFAAARAPFAEQLDAFATTNFASFGVLASAAPGESFRVHSGPGVPDRNTDFVYLHAGSASREIVAPTGTWQINFHGVASSSDASNPATVSVAIYVGEVAQRTYTATRTSTTAGEFVEVGRLNEYLRPGQADTITVGPGQRVTVRCAGIGTQTVGGVLVLWR
jgi:hypothetical protein